jgi:tetrahydromethanopterin S-methyltransferase subunit G
MAKSSNTADQIMALTRRMDEMELKVHNFLQELGQLLRDLRNEQYRTSEALSRVGLLPASQAVRGHRPESLDQCARRLESLDQVVKRIVPELSVQQALKVQQLIMELGAVQTELAQQPALDPQALRALFATLDQQVRRQILALLDSQAIRDRLGPQA